MGHDPYPAGETKELSWTVALELTEERTPTRMVIFWPENFYLERYDVS
jgi:hypothetical protein